MFLFSIEEKIFICYKKSSCDRKKKYIVAHLAEPCERRRGGLYEVNRKVYEKKIQVYLYISSRERAHRSEKRSEKYMKNVPL